MEAADVAAASCFVAQKGRGGELPLVICNTVTPRQGQMGQRGQQTWLVKALSTSTEY